MTAYFGTSGPMTSSNTAYSYLYAIDAAGRSLPVTLEVPRGNVLSGGLPALQDSDNQRLSVAAGVTLTTAESPVQVVVTSTAPTATLQDLRFRLEAKATSGSIRQSIELWDFVAGQYVSVDVRPSTLVYSTVEVTAANPSRFVQPGTRQIKAKLLWKATAPVLAYPWRVEIDRVMWTTR